MSVLTDHIRRSETLSEEFCWQLRMRAHGGSLETTRLYIQYFVSEEDAQKWFRRQEMLSGIGVKMFIDSLRPIKEQPSLEGYKGAGDFS